jgi:hypothetical protein
MMNPKDSAALTEVGPHNTIGVEMEDLPKAEKRALKKELEKEMAEARRRKLAGFQKNAWGDQENHTGHHNYGNRYTYGNS